MVETGFLRPITRRCRSLKKAEVSGASMAMPMRTRLPCCVPAGIFRRARICGSSQSKSVGLPAARNGPVGRRASCRIDFAGFRRGELHGQDAVLEFDGQQLRGGVHDVFGGGEIGALAAQAIGPEGNAQRQPQGLPRRHAHARNQQRPFADRVRPRAGRRGMVSASDW